MSKTFYSTNGPIKAVDNVNLAIPAGQVFGVLGPNGAGKTTTIKMMLGLVTPDAGRVRLNGFDVERSRSATVRQAGALLKGSRNVYWTLSAWQNLLYFVHLKGLPAALALTPPLTLFVYHFDTALLHLISWLDKSSLSCYDNFVGQPTKLSL